MKCTNCGTELENGQTVCPNCAAEAKPVRKTMKQRKKERIRNIVLAVAAGVLVVALVLTLVFTGINDGWGRENNVYRKNSYGASELIAQLNRGRVVAKAGEYTLTNGQLQVLYAMQVLDFVGSYGSYISYSGVDVTKPLSEQIYDKTTGLTWEKHFLQQALNEWLQYCALNTQAKKDKFEIPQEFSEHLQTLEQTMKDSAEKDKFASVDAMLQSDLGKNVRYDDYYNYVTMFYLSNLYIEDNIEKMVIATADIEQYFKDNEEDLKTNYGVTKDTGDYVDVRHILVMPKGGTKSEDGKTTTYSDEEWEACRVAAQAIYDEWLAGEKTENSFGKLANDKSEDQNGEVTNGGLYENVKAGQMVKAFNDWCFEKGRNPGDHGLVKTEYGYHVMYFVEAEAIWLRYCRAGVQSLKAQELIEECTKKLSWEVDYTAIVLDNIELS